MKKMRIYQILLLQQRITGKLTLICKAMPLQIKLYKTHLLRLLHTLTTKAKKLNKLIRMERSPTNQSTLLSKKINQLQKKRKNQTQKNPKRVF
jgi:hypothetical protein